MNLQSNIFDNWDDARSIINDWKRNGETIVFTNGCFDLLHAGHIHYLREASSLGQKLIIGLNSDRSVKELKGNSRPINKQYDRAFILIALEMIDLVLIFDQDNPLKLIKFIMPDILVKGGDWQIDDIIGAKEVVENKGTVKSLKYIDGYSTSALIDKLTNEN